MKKITCMVIVVFLMLSLVACKNDDNSQKDKQITDSNIITESQVLNPDETRNEEISNTDITFSYSYKVPGKNIVIDVPNYQEMEKGFSQLYILHGEKYVAVTAAKNSTATELSVAHEDAFAKFKENIQNYSYVNSLSITNDSTETINGIEVYKYEGTLNCGKDTIYDAYVIGYSFVMDGVPCTVTGSVINQEQPSEVITEMKATVEAMIKTLRSER